ncbi:putative D-aminoacylase [Hypoxylon argillaceum]|nr:putative D-aminoacylase [Hypoxylon argillaceum]
MDEETIISRLEATSSAIESVRLISGNAGLSLGVMHHGKAIYRANYGYRDVASRLPPTSDTVFPIPSMTKAMVASAFAALVDDGQLSWETKLSDLVPEYRQMSDHIKCLKLVTKANLIDLLANRLGLTAGNNFWSQKQQQVLVDKTETANILRPLQPLAPFRSKFIDNYTKCYMALSDTTPSEIPLTAAGACKSTVNDLMILYKAWMEAEAGGSGTTDTPFKRVTDTWTPHIELSVGLLGINGYECPELPTVAKGVEPQRLIYSQGSVCGSLNWTSQILLEALLDAPEPNDFRLYAEKTAGNAPSHYRPTVEQLAKEQMLRTKHQPLEEYCGRYYNQMGNFFLEISLHESGLKMCLQGYHYDTFAWPCDRDAESKLGLYPQFAIGLHKVSFSSDESENIISCNWQIDKAISQGEVFTKRY